MGKILANNAEVKPDFDPTSEQDCLQALSMSGCPPPTPLKAQMTFSTRSLLSVLTSPSSVCSVEKEMEMIDEFCSPELFASEPAAKEMFAAEVFDTGLTKAEAFAGVCSSAFRRLFSFRERLFSSCASVLFILSRQTVIFGKMR